MRNLVQAQIRTQGDVQLGGPGSSAGGGFGHVRLVQHDVGEVASHLPEIDVRELQRVALDVSGLKGIGLEHERRPIPRAEPVRKHVRSMRLARLFGAGIGLCNRHDPGRGRG